MNYIWELVILAKQHNVDAADITYKFGRPFSPYMELSPIFLNERNVILEAEINPYYRYDKILTSLLEPNFDENPEIIEVLLDLIIHHLADIDIFQGMNRREFHVRFIIRDMQEGYFGNYVKERINLFDKSEQRIIANNILILYQTGECIYLLKNTIGNIYKRAYIFSNAEEKDEIIFYLRQKQTPKDTEKIEMIKVLFAPFKCRLEVYWEYAFGIIDVDELMKIDSIMMY